MIRAKLKKLLETLYKNIVIILLTATVCVILSIGYTVTNTEPFYSARGKVLVHNGSLGEIATADSKISLVETCEEIFNSQSMIKYFKEYHLDDSRYTVSELDEIIEVSAEGKNSLVLNITVTCDDPDKALYIIESFIIALPDYSRFVSSELMVNELYVDEEATLNKPDMIAIIIVSLLAGAVLASVAVILRDALNRKIRSAEDYKAKFSAPILGVVPNFETKGKEED